MVNKKHKRVEPKQKQIGTKGATSPNPSKNMKKEVLSTNTTGESSTIRIEVQNYVDYLRARFEATKNSKQPHMCNTGKSVTYVKKGKDGNFRGLKTIIEG